MYVYSCIFTVLNVVTGTVVDSVPGGWSGFETSEHPVYVYCTCVTLFGVSCQNQFST